MEARVQDYGSIGWAISHVRLGHKMRRQSWPAGSFIFLDEAGPTITYSGMDQVGQTTTMDYNAHNRDLLSRDWQMLEPTLPGEYHA